jgi:hypothetical protein
MRKLWMQLLPHPNPYDHKVGKGLSYHRLLLQERTPGGLPQELFHIDQHRIVFSTTLVSFNRESRGCGFGNGVCDGEQEVKRCLWFLGIGCRCSSVGYGYGPGVVFYLKVSMGSF